MIRDAVYRLKRNYGEPADFYMQTSSVVDRATGNKTTNRLKVHVARVIAMTSRNQREMYFDRAYITANRNFTYGALIDTNQRLFIVDRRDLRGKAFEILAIGQWLVFNGQRFDIKEVAEYDEANAYGLICKQTVAADQDRIIDIKAASKTTLGQDAPDPDVSIPAGNNLGLSDSAEAVIG
jgi:hypothetical protein